MWRDGNDVCVEIEDEGKGIAAEKRSATGAPENVGVGIRGMRERIRQLGGSLEISDGRNGRGTLVSVCVPFQGPAIWQKETEDALRY